MIKKTGVYPGTFDPPTNGHIDIIQRALKLFDKLIIGISNNPAKSPLFSIEERVEMLNVIFSSQKEIKIVPFSNLLINFVESQNAFSIVRGLRAVSDFEYELQLASFNAHLNDKIDTVFLMAKDENLFLSSSLIKEVARFGGDVSKRVHPVVWNYLKERFGFK